MPEQLALNELNKPLGKDKEELSDSFGPTLLRWSIVSIAAILISFFAWITLTENPLGGQPTATAIVNSGGSLDSRDVAVLEIDQAELLQPDEPEISDGSDNQVEAATLIEIDKIDDAVPTNDDIIIRQLDESLTTVEPRLSHLPEPELIENTVNGDLPRRSRSGRQPFKAYARPAGASGGFGTARVAIIVGGLGLSQTGTEAAIDALPGAVTLAFAPYGNSLDRWVSKARREGHELLVQAPMEPFDYPINDPGPHTLRIEEDAKVNQRKLHWVLGRITNYVGVMNFMGARFSSHGGKMSAFMTELHNRGLMYVDDGSALRSEADLIAEDLSMPFVRANILLDGNPEGDAVQAQLLKLEQAARNEGIAIGTASAFPASVRRIAQWVAEAERKGIDVVPISALAFAKSYTGSVAGGTDSN